MKLEGQIGRPAADAWDEIRDALAEGRTAISSARGVHHHALFSTDLERTARFYRDLLGFRVVERIEHGDGVTHLLFDAGEGTLLAFFDFPGLDLTSYADVLGAMNRVDLVLAASHWDRVRSSLVDGSAPHSVAGATLRVEGPDGEHVELTRLRTPD